MAYYNAAQGQPEIQYQGQPQIQYQGHPQFQYQGQPQIQYPAPIIYYAAPAPAPAITNQQAVIKHYGPHYERLQSVGLGATQIVLACLSITAGVTALVYDAVLSYIGIGIWAGAFYLAAGSVAVAAGKDPTNKLIKATLVCSVFDILLGFGHITAASIGVAEEVECYSYYYYSCNDWWGAAVASNSMMIGVAALEIIFGIWLTAISGRAIRKGSKAQGTTIPVTYAPHQPETVFIQAPPTLQPMAQPPQYYVQPQYPSTSNPQQMMYVGVHQAPLTAIKL